LCCCSPPLAITALVPFTPLAPGWQGRLARTLLDSASLPLLSLALLPIGRWLDPADPLLKRRRRSFSRLAGAAALGFLLLVPLQVSANLCLEQLGGPRPAPSDLALPLPLLKAQVISVFDQSQAQINRERNALPRTGPLRLLPELLRTSLASLILALGYAIFSTSADSDLSLFEQLQPRVWGLMPMRSGRNRRSQAQSDEEYLRQLRGEDEG